MIFLGLLVILLLIIDHSQLRIDERISWVNLLGLHEGKRGSFEIVSPQIFHSHIQMGLRTTREQPDNGPINGHGLVGLILNSKGVSHSYPSE